MPPPIIYYMCYAMVALLILYISWLAWPGLRRWLVHIKNRIQHGRRTVATKCDYSPNARLLGNGIYFTGKYDFLVSVCPRCGDNRESNGCFICGKHNVYATRKFSTFPLRKLMLSCRDCWDSRELGSSYYPGFTGYCMVCKAVIGPVFVNFYEGSLPVLTPVIEPSIVRGPGRPEVAVVEHLEMPTKAAPVEDNRSSLN